MVAPVVGTAGFDECRRFSRKIFFLVPSRNLSCQTVITMARLFSRPPKEVEQGQHAENYGCGSCARCLRRINGISLRR